MKKLLIVVDFQNDFIDGSLGFSKATTLVDKINKKINEYLDNGDDLIYTLDTHYDNYLETYEGVNLPVKHCILNTFGHKVNDLCNYLDKAIKVFEKNTFPSLELAKYLETTSYDFVELCGLVSNICVLSNAIMVKSALPNATIVIDSSLTASFDEELENKAFDVLKGLQITIK